MDIKRIAPTATVEFTLARKDEKGNPLTVKLEVSYVSADEVADFVEPGKRFRVSRAIRETLIDAVVSWDLTEDGQPVECDDRNRRRILPWLLGEELADDRPEEERRGKDGKPVPHPTPINLVLGRRLLAFAADDGNFLKN